MTRRWPALVLIPVLLVGALLFDQRNDTARARRVGTDAPGSVAEASAVSGYMPVAPGADALSSLWFCAAGTASGDGQAEQAVVISNPGSQAVSGAVTAVPSIGKPVTRQLTVPARSRTRVNLPDLVKAAYVSAQVEFRGGQVAVEHELSGPLGIDAAPCSSSASSTWYFASGATTLDAVETLVLFNPYLDPATVDISFATPEGRRVPGKYQGFQVPARSVVPITINPEVTADLDVSTSVVARRGRIVVDRIQTFNNKVTLGAAESAQKSFRPRGLTVAPGVPMPATAWMFPVGVKDEGVHERFVVYNPGDAVAEVEVGVTLVDPEVNGVIDPFSVTVPGGTFQVVDLDKESRVPDKVEHSTVVVSTNRVPVVVDRTIATEKPYPTQDTGVSSGTPLVSRQWLFVSGGNVPDKLSERIAVQNPSGSKVTVRLEVIADGKATPVAGVGPVELGPYEHTVVRFGDKLDNRQVSVMVKATGPIAAERLLLRINDVGLSTAMGIPSADSLSRVPASALEE